ncbi:signal transduction histidine kinase [Clavibacter michiganensis]|uniref:sensor histidine kinase n=1 Tax=Clavibacter michiganensis TaxID=28447 RepID=UPI00195608D4|nr:histidine kinase [Clavibacter michiganensis]MBM7411313.1 signal transduction histidine kinase [Clavibacter michiganensis]
MTSSRMIAHAIAPLGGVVFAGLWVLAEAGRADLAGAATLAVALGAAIALGVWLPAASLAIVVVIPVLQLVGLAPAAESTTWPMHAAIGVVVLLIAATGARRTRLAALPVGILAAGAAALHVTMPTGAVRTRLLDWTDMLAMGGARPVGDAVVVLLLAAVGAVVLAWALGFGVGAALRLRRLGAVLVEAEGRLAETDLELRLGIERARISRDVHDSVAHALTIVVAQSEGATAMSARRPEIVAGALTAISGVARDALTDVRGLIERITEAGDELLSLADLPALVERMRDVGMGIALDELGERRALRPAHQLAVYRIVQESLTNALKHGGAEATAAVVLDWRGPGLALLVRSSGRSPLVQAGSLTGSGAGIPGMRERARIAGGWLTAEPDADGEFVVTAFLPLDGAASSAEPAPAAPSTGTIAIRG